ncbi:Fe-S cluster assembly sulfur transfer protein SufU [Bombiscardovia coagulans]|uniref:Iron-sulfur cluster assembly scaffold protein n=1 Tax=Bombiscardovia coagulans TaxID=686666 RepID=A0A261ESX4_9BIFI|nr:SUF system NifU family Fe-S cluster assembly protein [Bombiscardovia coagulans]OZG49960.1 iron-sulfur cluster assembly scaffold protein [Bombiscardovia coagulans]
MVEDFGMGEQELQEMYQEVILDASKHPHGKIVSGADSSLETVSIGAHGGITLTSGHEACKTAQSQQFNPTCGDTATVYVEVSSGSNGNSYRIERIAWDGQGCSISQASLSIMVDLVQGQTVDKAMALAQDFQLLMHSRGVGLDDNQANDDLGDAIVFQGVSRYPMRIKCALLGWEGMKASIAQAMTQFETADVPAVKSQK